MNLTICLCRLIFAPGYAERDTRGGETEKAHLPFLLPGLSFVGRGSSDTAGRVAGRPVYVPSGWCSVKIILLCLGLALVLVYLARLLRNFGRPALAWFILGCSILPGAGLLAGFFLLLKAIF